MEAISLMSEDNGPAKPLLFVNKKKQKTFLLRVDSRDRFVAQVPHCGNPRSYRVAAPIAVTVGVEMTFSNGSSTPRSLRQNSRACVPSRMEYGNRKAGAGGGS
jgi:hypothetical protein